MLPGGLKNLAVIVALVTLFSNTAISQSDADENNHPAQSSSARLEILMKSTEESMRYEAPSVYVDEVDRLNEATEIENALCSLERLANSIEKELKYVAPDDDVEFAHQNLEWLASVTEKNLEYKAPSIESHLTVQNKKGDEEFSSGRVNHPVQVELANYTMQEIWLIKAGYYKDTRTPAWHRMKNTYRSKKVAKQYASKF